MKKVILLVIFCSFLFVSCGDKKTKVKDTPETKVEATTEVEETTEVETEIVDSLATELEKTKEELEKANKEIDQLLEEL